MEFIEKYRMNSIFSYTYNHDRVENSHCLIIGTINGKYGILDNYGEFFLPFEYDYISRIGIDILQLSKDNKHGFTVIGNEQDEVGILAGEPECGNFYIETITPCEYDNITMPIQNEVLALINYYKNGQDVRFYCRWQGKITKHTYQNFTILSERLNLIKLYREITPESIQTYIFNYHEGEILSDVTLNDYWV